MTRSVIGIVLQEPNAARPARASPVKEGGAGSGGPAWRFWVQFRQPPMLRATPMAWKPTPTTPRRAVIRSHQRVMRRGRAAFPIAAAASMAAAAGGAVTGSSMAGLWKAPRKCSSPASIAVPTRPAPVIAATIRPAGSPSTSGGAPGGLSRTRSARNPVIPASKIAAGAPSGAP